MNKKKIATTAALVACLAIGVVSGILLSNNSSTTNSGNSLVVDDGATDWNGNQQVLSPHIGNIEAIAIPGFKSMTFAANQTEQLVNLYNPKENTCLFLMTMFVDGEEVWKSGYVEAGKGYYKIKLNKTLEVGEYKGNLRIQCFRTDGTSLNSANISFNLLVEKEV